MPLGTDGADLVPFAFPGLATWTECAPVRRLRERMRSQLENLNESNRVELLTCLFDADWTDFSWPVSDEMAKLLDEWSGAADCFAIQALASIVGRRYESPMLESEDIAANEFTFNALTGAIELLDKLSERAVALEESPLGAELALRGLALCQLGAGLSAEAHQKVLSAKERRAAKKPWACHRFHRRIGSAA